MNPIIREHIISACLTFATGFLTTAGAMLSIGTIEWTSAFWVAVLLSGVRAGIKEVVARLAPVSLGGRP